MKNYLSLQKIDAEFINNVPLDSLEPLQKHYEEKYYNISSVCPIHPCRRMDVLNYYRNIAHGEPNLKNLIKFDKIAVLVINSKQADMPVPTLRLFSINENYQTSSPIVCTCTRAEQKILYSALPQMRNMAREKALEADIIKIVDLR